jgi:hypothetical protein
MTTYKEQLESAKRELAMRERVYPQWVYAERMTQQKADHEIAAMRAIVATLTPLADREAGQGTLFG